MSKNQTLQHKRSSVAGNRPTTAQIQPGELAINFPDLSIYTSTGTAVIELERNVIKSATAPIGQPTGTLWWNSTDSEYMVFDGTNWVNIVYNGSQVDPINVTSSAPTTGSGTQASPYVITANSSVGATQLMSTITVTGLAPGQIVPIVDNNSAANGNRFRITNNIANATGTLVFNIMFVDFPRSTSSITYTANIVVGTGSAYIRVNSVITAIFPQSVTMPNNTLAATTSWTSPADTLTSTGSLTISKDGATFNTGPLAISTGDTLSIKWAGAPGSGTGIDGANGSTIIGSVVSSSGGTQSSSLTIDKTPDTITFLSQTGVPLNTPVASNTVTISGINSYSYLTSSDIVDAAIGGASYASIPSSGTSLYVINGQNLTLRQTSSGAVSTTTTVTVAVGGTNTSFSVTTSNNSVNTPVIVTPINNSTGIATSVTITSSAYGTVGTVGSHASSDWELATNSGFSPLVMSTTITGWIPRTSGSIQQLHGSAWSGTQWVVVGDNGTVLTSPNGINWTSRSSGSTEFFKGVAWGNSQFVIASDSIFTSPDGITWTQRVSSGTFDRMEAVAWGNNQWVAVGNDRRIITSTDGITWTSRYSATGGRFDDLVWNGSMWVVVGYNSSSQGFIVTSPDGLTWTSRTIPDAIAPIAGLKPELTGVTWGNGQFVTVGGRPGVGFPNFLNLPSAILTSPDGINWTYRVGTGTDRIDDVTWTGTKYVAVGDFGLTISSDDGITWINTGSGFSTSGSYSISWNGSQLLATAFNGVIVTASSGNVAQNLTSWRPDSLLPGTTYWVRVRYRSTDPIVSGWSQGSTFTTA